ncbi:DUF3775 domain-containing protein [Breoghania sp.]|uniref:DUF3775 domain-containing protein n=1 Tax=Breoghania sp. TaxID=2065378 RepID=UPI002AAADE60|nr:DUF3775 domain-containing protein [Breoghania sp.]
MPRLRRLSISRSKLGLVIDMARSGTSAPGRVIETSRVMDAANDVLTLHLEEMNKLAQCDLLALAWLGREGAPAMELEDFRLDARRAWTRATASYLASMSELGDFLENAISTLEKAPPPHTPPPQGEEAR